VNSGQGSNCLG